jgi:23S rRNA pseudouridine2605 synthase
MSSIRNARHKLLSPGKPDDGIQAAQLRFEDETAVSVQPVVASATLPLRNRTWRFYFHNQSQIKQTLQCGVKRSRAHTEFPVRQGGHLQHDGVAVLFPLGQRKQNIEDCRRQRQQLLQLVWESARFHRGFRPPSCIDHGYINNRYICQAPFAELPHSGIAERFAQNRNRPHPFQNRVTLLFNTVKTAKRVPRPQPNTKHVGLARALSKLGFCSRSRACELIREGKVRLNGTVVRNPESPARLGKDRIEMAGKPVTAAEKVYFVLNKPRGIVTTAADEKGRDTVYSLLPSHLPWIAPAGRLDRASEGLLLLTNDSEWAARITDPASHLDKTYHVQIAAVADAGLLEALQLGIRDSTGNMLMAKHASILRRGEKNSWLEMILDEGKNRQIRRMLEGLGAEVLRLIRVSIGPLQLGNLAKGAVRPLQRHEKLALDCVLHNISLAAECSSKSQDRHKPGRSEK